MTTTDQTAHNRHRITVPGSRADLQVPFTEVRLTDSAGVDGPEPNAPVHLYTTAGPGSDPRVGLEPVRDRWIVERGDTEIIEGRRADARDGRRGDLTGRHGSAPNRGRGHHRGGRELCPGGVQRTQPVDAVPEGPHDPPSAEQGPRGNGGGAGHDRPERHLQTGPAPTDHQREGDDAHALLGFVGAMNEREGRDGGNLGRTQAAVPHDVRRPQ